MSGVAKLPHKASNAFVDYHSLTRKEAAILRDIQQRK